MTDDTKRQEQARRLERRRWRELRDTYAACKKIAAQVWDDELDAARVEQQILAETMRDRVGDGLVRARESREIHVPLLTPRDRLQFLKEVTVALKMSAERMNLTVTHDHGADIDPGDAWVEVTAPADGYRRVFEPFGAPIGAPTVAINAHPDLGACDVAGCDKPATCEWPLLGRKVCGEHYKPEFAPAGAFDPPDDFEIPDDPDHG